MDMALDAEEREMEQEQARMWIDYLSRTFAQQPMAEPDQQYKRAKKEFEDMLMPTPKAPTQTFEWDFSLLERHKEGR